MRQDFVREEKAVIDAEWEHITDSWITRWMARQGKAGGAAAGVSKLKEAAALDRADSRGLALSGGGIRSAAFAIGALQALNKSYALSRIHYLSTVSGGGYAGSALTWFFRAKSNSNVAYDTAKNFPLSAVIEGKDGATLTDLLRFRASYLEPGRGMSTLALAAVVLRSVVMSLLAYFLLLTTLLYAIAPWFIDRAQALCPWLGGSWAHLAAIASVLAVVILYLLSNLNGALSFSSFEKRQQSEKVMPLIFGLGIASFGLAMLPWLSSAMSDMLKSEGLFGNLSKTAAVVGPLVAVAGSLSSHLLMSDSGAPKKNRLGGLLLWISGLLLVLSIALMSYSAVHVLASFVERWWIGLAGLVVATIAVGAVSNLNYTGLHRFYRDRLMEAFLPNPQSDDGGQQNASGTGRSSLLADGFALEDACAKGVAGPLHLINCNVVLTSSNEDMYFSRGGDSFTLSPVYCGGDATGWRETTKWILDDATDSPWPYRLLNLVGLKRMRRMTLATAMAISGAAVNPRTNGEGPARSGLLSFVSTLFNIRLGYWVQNPMAESGAAFASGRKWIAWYPPNFLHPGVLGGLFSGHKHEKARWIELSDGGHFDNIGIYELIRRRIKNIIIIDGTADPDLKLESFANAYERARNDFNVKIDISSFPANFDDMMPGTARPNTAVSTERKLAERGWAVGKIFYPDDPVPGYVFYVNTVLTERLPANLYSYHAAHKSYPDEPTSDQFFDEQQFEAYRELGQEITWDMLRSVAAYRDLALAAGLVPTPGEVKLNPKKSRKAVECAELLRDFARQFPDRKPMAIADYLPDPDRLAWPPVGRNAPSKGKKGKQGR